jgi:hypothetical protein
MRDTPPFHYWAVGWMFLGVCAVLFCLQIVICPSITWIRNWCSSDQWILRQVLKFKPCRAKHHAKHNRWWWSDNMGRLITLLDFSPAEFKWFLTVLADRHLFCNHYLFKTGLVANGIGLTRRCSARCLHAPTVHVVFRILASLSRCWLWCVFSQSGWLLYNDSPTDVK